MLQQTRVETVLPYYLRWMERFPTLGDLAAAERGQVLSLWEGLGYYRRAHHLHQAAQQVVAAHSGAIPDRVSELEKLPGIGRYTAAAIAAIAFNQDVIALDGNLRRVFSRLIDLDADPRTAQGEERVSAWVREHLPRGRASEFNQAFMDLGAGICTPRAPKCAICPLAAFCKSFAHGVQESRPVRPPRRPSPKRTVAAGVLWRDDKVLIGRRPEGELLGGLWEFPGGTREGSETLEACLEREWQEELGVRVKARRPLGSFEHAYTHFRVTVHVFVCRLVAGEPRPLEHDEIRWVAVRDLEGYPMGKIDRQISLALRRYASNDSPRSD